MKSILSGLFVVLTSRASSQCLTSTKSTKFKIYYKNNRHGIYFVLPLIFYKKHPMEPIIK